MMQVKPSKSGLMFYRSVTFLLSTPLSGVTALGVGGLFSRSYCCLAGEEMYAGAGVMEVRCC